MAFAHFTNVKIKGMLTVVPEQEINIYDEAEYYGNSIKKIDRMRKMVGFYKRRVADMTTTPADLAYDAARKLIDEMKIDKDSIDALVFVVQQPDVMNPATAYFIHQKLGLSDNCLATDINQGCVGWVYGLYMAHMMIASGMHKRILLLNGDTPSVGVDLSNRNVAPIFGDGGTATLLEKTENHVDAYFNIETQSYGYEAIIAPFSGTRFRTPIINDEDFELLSKLRKERIMMPTGNDVSLFSGYIDGLAVFDFTVKFVPENIKKLLNFAQTNKDEISALCLHQANKQIVQAVAAGAGFDETDEKRVPYQAFENYGNNTMCSIPTTIALLDKSIAKDKLLCCAFGNGLVSTSSILNLEDTYLPEIKNFDKPSYVMTRDEYINYWRNKIKGEN